MKNRQRFEHLVDTGHAGDAVLAQHRVDHAVRADQRAGMAEGRAAGSLGAPNLEHDDWFASVGRAFAGAPVGGQLPVQPGVRHPEQRVSTLARKGGGGLVFLTHRQT